jgi:hypothetical protein
VRGTETMSATSVASAMSETSEDMRATYEFK